MSPWLSDRRDRLAIAAVVVLAVLAHATALGGGYVWLDHTHLEEGLALAAPREWPALFTRGFAGTGFYRPLMALSLSADALVSKTPAWFRLVTLAWHAAAAVATLLAGRTLGMSRRGALIAAGLFAVHPATSLVADAIAFRSEAMITVALLVLVIAHLREKPLLAGAALLAGALIKETAWVLAPLLLLTLELLRRFDGSSRVPGERASLRLLLWEGIGADFGHRSAQLVRAAVARVFPCAFVRSGDRHAARCFRQERSRARGPSRSDDLRCLPGDSARERSCAFRRDPCGDAGRPGMETARPGLAICDRPFAVASSGTADALVVASLPLSSAGVCCALAGSQTG